MSLIAAAVDGAEAQQIDRYFSPGMAGYGPTPGVTVLSRLRPDYEPAGTRVGSFIVNAGLSQGLGYDTNATGQPQPGASLYLQTEANVSARSDWGRHSLALVAGMNNKAYPAQSQQSTLDWNIAIAGAYDIGHDQVGLDLSHVRSAQTPRDLSIPLVSTPAPYTVDSVRTSYTATFGRFALVPSVEYGVWRYGEAMQGSVPVSLGYQNRNVLTATLVGRYQASEQRTLLVVLRGLMNDYVAPLAGQPSRNSNGGDFLVGFEYGADAVWRYRALVGYQTRQYESAAYPPLNGPTFEAGVIWQPTGLTSVTGTVLHTIAESALTTETSYTLSQLRIVVDHELRRNILLQARGEIDRAVYPQNAGNATLWLAGASATWLMNRRMRLTASYDYSTRQSGPSSYNESVVLLRLGFRL